MQSLLRSVIVIVILHLLQITMAAILAGHSHGPLSVGATLSHFPSNERVCNMYRHGEPDLWGASHANYYFSSFMRDNGGSLGTVSRSSSLSGEALVFSIHSC